MKRTLVLLLALSACTPQSSPAPTPSPTSPAQSQAADLRTHLDLLLGEQVMMIAKETAAAVNHSDEYALYTPELGLNTAELSRIIAQAFGNNSGVQFMSSWTAQNSALVDYAIGVVTHNSDKSNAASTSLSATFVPQFAQTVSSFSGLPRAPLTELTSTQVLEDLVFIDDLFAGKLHAFYSDLHTAYGHASRLGDLLSNQMAAEFPDKFPGDPLDPAAGTRVSLNLVLEEHSYLATMATDATVSGRASDRTEALSAIMANNEAMRSIVQDNRFSLAWSFEIGSLDHYASNGDPASKSALTDTFVSQLGALLRGPSNAITYHENAAIKVVDDQRSKAPTLAGDDRAAATSMQPIADSVEG
ncbi:MAG TPA: hypothetical protein VFR33_00120 [Candidatus Dormibacteraeota bacterium]|nr:hypothetical protein [Candidatus Dormibacteraeota bacterium]